MKHSGVLFLFVIGLSVVDRISNMSEIEYIGISIFVAIVAVLYQLEDMEDKL